MSLREIPYRFITSSELSRMRFNEEHKRYGQHEKNLKPASRLTKISLWTRVWYGHIIFGALEFRNNSGDVVFAGERHRRYATSIDFSSNH